MKVSDLRLGWLVIAFGIIGVALFNFAHPQIILWDQDFIRYQFRTGFPQLELGMFSYIWVGLYHFLFTPGEATLNAQIKSLAAAQFLICGFLLGSRVLKSSGLLTCFAILLIFSRFPFLWLSTELLASSLLSLAVWFWLSGEKRVFFGFFLGLFGLCKPDLVVPAGAILVFSLWHDRTRRPLVVQTLTGFGGVVLGLFLPSVVIHGQKSFGGRSYLSFSQHYATLFGPHQVVPQGDPFTYGTLFIESIFPKATEASVWKIVSLYPRKYLDFLVLSVTRGFTRFTVLMGFLTPLMVWRIWSGVRGRKPALKFEVLLVVSLIGLLPIFMVSFPHIRYMARYYPFFLLVALKWVEGLSGVKRSFGMALITLSIAVQGALFFRDINQIESLNLFWFPD